MAALHSTFFIVSFISVNSKWFLPLWSWGPWKQTVKQTSRQTQQQQQQISPLSKTIKGLFPLGSKSESIPHLKLPFVPHVCLLNGSLVKLLNKGSFHDADSRNPCQASCLCLYLPLFHLFFLPPVPGWKWTPRRLSTPLKVSASAIMGLHFCILPGKDWVLLLLLLFD